MFAEPNTWALVLAAGEGSRRLPELLKLCLERRDEHGNLLLLFRLVGGQLLEAPEERWRGADSGSVRLQVSGSTGEQIAALTALGVLTAS